MRYRNTTLAACCAVALSSYSSIARAELYCVSTAAQLRSAFVNAAASASASEIRVRNGFYALPAADATSTSLRYSGASDLEVSGGWDGLNGSCTDRFGPQESTVLSADGVGRLLDIFIPFGASNTIILRNLGFRDGAAGNSGLAACVNIESDAGSQSMVMIDNNSFRLCSTAGIGAALRVLARSVDVRVRNNLFTDNVSQLGIVRLFGLGASNIYFSNNTLVNNPQIDLDGGPGGVQITSQANDFIWFTNNVLWKNGSSNGTDLFVSVGTVAALNNNLIGTMAPLPAGVINNATLSVDPGFVSASNFRPGAGSVLRNSGIGPVGGVTVLDLGSASRVQGARIDRGAYEFSELFASGFE